MRGLNWRHGSALLLVSACATATRPATLQSADAFESGPQGRAAASLAPQAHAHAVALKERAEDLVSSDSQGASILGEQSVAAFEKAFALARLAKATERELRAHAGVEQMEKTLAQLDAQIAVVGSEANALEMRVNVARDAVPLIPSGPADPKREAARRVATKSLLLQARMLCVSAQMLAADGDQLKELFSQLDEADTKLTAGVPAPIDAASSLRAACLKLLARTRSPEQNKHPDDSATDTLLSKLSQAKLEPHRDDRGVVVTLRPFAADGSLSEAGKTTLQALTRVAKSNPGFPVLVAAHATGPRADVRAQDQALKVREEFARSGLGAVEIVNAGSSLPLTDARSASAQASNERVEIVFVSRSW